MDSMISQGIIGITTALLLLSGSTFANAASPWSAMEKIGLNGTWAQSCRAPSSPHNVRVTFYRGADNRVWRKLDRGANAFSLNLAVDSAQVITSTKIQARMRNADPNWGPQNGVVTDLVIEVANNRMRTLDSTTPDGAKIIKDGFVVSSGSPIPSFEKCSN